MPGVGRNAHADAGLQRFAAEVGAPGPGGDHHMRLGPGRVDAQFFVTEKNQRPHVGAVQTVARHDFAAGLSQRGAVERQIDGQDVGRILQPAQMLGQAKECRAGRRLVGADALETAVAVMQRVGEHGHFGLGGGQPLPVQPDQTVAVLHDVLLEMGRVAASGSVRSRRGRQRVRRSAGAG